MSTKRVYQRYGGGGMLYLMYKTQPGNFMMLSSRDVARRWYSRMVILLSTTNDPEQLVDRAMGRKLSENAEFERKEGRFLSFYKEMAR